MAYDGSNDSTDSQLRCVHGQLLIDCGMRTVCIVGQIVGVSMDQIVH